MEQLLFLALLGVFVLFCVILGVFIVFILYINSKRKDSKTLQNFSQTNTNRGSNNFEDDYKHFLAIEEDNYKLQAFSEGGTVISEQLSVFLQYSTNILDKFSANPLYIITSYEKEEIGNMITSVSQRIDYSIFQIDKNTRTLDCGATYGHLIKSVSLFKDALVKFEYFIGKLDGRLENPAHIQGTLSLIAELIRHSTRELELGNITLKKLVVKVQYDLKVIAERLSPFIRAGQIIKDLENR